MVARNFFAVGIAVLFSASAYGQVYKCKNAQGKMEYSDAPCAGAVAMGISNSPSEPAAASNNPNERALRIYFNEALARKDYAKATSLATTPDQVQMVIDAQEADRRVKADARERKRVTFCNTTGTTMDLGGMRSNNATTVCR